MEEEKSLISLKIQDDNFRDGIEFEVLPVIDLNRVTDKRCMEIIRGLQNVDEQLKKTQEKLQELNVEIDRLTNHADGFDYVIAVSSGVLAAIIDSLWVGEFSFEQGKAWSNRSVNEFVVKMAKNQGYSGERLDGAIQSLENQFQIPSDSIWMEQDIGVSAKSHHLDDLAHHPTPLGLLCSIATQFTQKGYFQNSQGVFTCISIVDGNLIGNDLPHKIFAGTVNWFFHLISDMSGSNKTAGVGMGIPGPIVSLLKEISLIPGINQTSLAQNMKDVFVKEKFDLRSELAVLHQLGRQAVPVILNEVMVRAFYFIRQLYKQFNEKKNFREIEWKTVLPFNNRTIARMVTIATGTFTIMDMADAGIRAAIKSGGINGAAFLTNFVLRVNFVGIGRFALACITDIKMGFKKSSLRNERLEVYSKVIFLNNAKVFYKQADMWISAENAFISIEKSYELISLTSTYFVKSWSEIQARMENIADCLKEVEKYNPKIVEDIKNIL